MTIYCSSKACLPSQVLRVSDPSFSPPAVLAGAWADRISDAPDSAPDGRSAAPAEASARPAESRCWSCSGCSAEYPAESLPDDPRGDFAAAVDSAVQPAD